MKDQSALWTERAERQVLVPRMGDTLDEQSAAALWAMQVSSGEPGDAGEDAPMRERDARRPTARTDDPVGAALSTAGASTSAFDNALENSLRQSGLDTDTETLHMEPHAGSHARTDTATDGIDGADGNDGADTDGNANRPSLAARTAAGRDGTAPKPNLRSSRLAPTPSTAV